jgi:hypothetical protein
MSIGKYWVIVLLCSVVSVEADTLITANEGSSPAGSPPASDREQVQTRQIWSRADRMASISNGSRMVGRLDRGETYLINDTKKTCMRIKHQEPQEYIPSEKDPVFLKTGETRQVGSWQAVGYEATIALGASDSYKVVVWISEDATLGLEDYRTYTKAIVTPGSFWVLDSLSLGGYPVRQETTIGPTASWVEFVSVEDKKPPAGIYEIPNGYSGCE